jgi:hypothetical protein
LPVHEEFEMSLKAQAFLREPWTAHALRILPERETRELGIPKIQAVMTELAQKKKQ